MNQVAHSDTVSVAVTADGRVLVSTEGQFTDVLEVPLPRAVAERDRAWTEAA